MSPEGTFISVRRAQARGIATASIVLLAVQACRSWEAETRPVTQVTATAAPTVQVRLAAGGVIQMRGAHVVGDSLLGYKARSTRVAVALADIRTMEVRKRDTAKTTMLAAIVVVGVGVVITLLAHP